MLTPTRYNDPSAARMIVPLIAGGRTSRERPVLDANLPDRLAHAPSVLGYLHQLYAAGGFSSHPWPGKSSSARSCWPAMTTRSCRPNARYLAHAIPRAQLT